MAFNSTKFHPIIDGERENFPEYLDSEKRPISKAESVKDLRVMLQNDGRYDIQIQSVVSKVSQMCGWALRTFCTREKCHLITIYKSLVLPHIDY